MTPRRVRIFLAGLIVAAQVLFAFQGIADEWLRGHNGWNGAAYNLAARNSLRWGELFPSQYYTEPVPPPRDKLYGHAPLALHAHVTASVALFGDHEWAVRLVPAVNGILALLALMWFCRRWFGADHALLAGAIYVALPINAIYANMANHSTGAILWQLAFLHGYLEWRRTRRWRWYALLLGGFAMAALWHFPPPYIVVLVLAVHWLVTLRRGPGLLADLGALALLSGWVLAQFGLHLWLVERWGPGVEELFATARKRTALPWGSWAYQLRVVPALMYTWPILAALAVWLGRWVVAVARRQGTPGDVAVLALCVSGIATYLAFKSSAMVHDYWSWPLVPGIAMAAASVLLWIAARFRRRAVGALVVALCLAPLASRHWTLVPDGRRVGGSLWFVAPVRGPRLERYVSGRRELAFADFVRGQTTRGTGVMVHASFDRFRPEPRFDTALDRHVEKVHALPRAFPASPGVTDGWVFIAVDGAVPAAQLAALRHPVLQFDRYVMVDFRKPGSGAERRVWSVAAGRPSAAWWFLVNPWEPPLVVTPPTP